MATRKSSRSNGEKRPHQGGNRPRTHPTPRTHKKPAPPRKSKLRKAPDARPDAKSIRGNQAAERYRLSPTQAVREMRDGVPATALRAIRGKLELIQSTAVVVAHALREQNCELDDDAGRVLVRHVTDALADQIESIDFLLEGGES